MITAEQLARLTNYSADDINRVMQDSGYSEDTYLTARFLGLTNSGQFCYSVQYDYPGEGLTQSKVFLTYNPGGPLHESRVTADY